MIKGAVFEVGDAVEARESGTVLLTLAHQRELLGAQPQQAQTREPGRGQAGLAKPDSQRPACSQRCTARLSSALLSVCPFLTEHRGGACTRR